jgi:hypothetical protein
MIKLRRFRIFRKPKPTKIPKLRPLMLGKATNIVKRRLKVRNHQKYSSKVMKKRIRTRAQS